MPENREPCSLSKKTGLRRVQVVREGRWVRMRAPGLNFPTLGALAIIVVYFLVSVTGGLANEAGELRALFSDFGVSWRGLQEGKWWSLLSHAFLHGSWAHVFLNAALLYYGAARLEFILGNQRAWRVFVLGTLAGAVAQVIGQAFLPQLNQGPLVGASGGVMALLIALCTVAPESRMLLLPVSAKNLGLGVLLAAFLLFLMTPGLGVPVLDKMGRLLVNAGWGEIFFIGHLYHLFGGLAGWWWASRLFGKPVTLVQLKKERAEKERA